MIILRRGLLLIAALLLSYQPASTDTIIVPPGGDLQAAINAARPGDTIVLQADADYTCSCVLPVKAGSEFVTIKSSAYEQIPVRSFYSREPGADVVNLMPRIKSNHSTEPVFTTTPGAHHYKLLGLNLQPPAGQGTRIMELGTSGTAQDTLEEMPHDFVIDKSWLHAAIDQEMQRCVALNSSNTEITNSWLTECHGQGYDTQAICGWNGGGGYRIINNSLSGAGENFMLGGATASIPGLVPTGIEFRRNYVWKSLTWYVNDPSYASRHWTVKNLFELKNARRVVIDGNVFENNWTDAQAGRAILFTPRPSDSGLAAVVEDVDFRNNIVKNVESGLSTLGIDSVPQPLEVRLRRIRISNNVFDNVYFGAVFTIIDGSTDVTIEHNTLINSSSIIVTDYNPSPGLIYRDNISRHNLYGIFGSGKGIGNPGIDYYFPNSIITGNVIAKEIDAPWNVESLYPAGNLFPATLAEVFSDLSIFQVSSLYAGKGADYNLILAAINGAPTPQATPSPTPLPSPSPSPSATPTPTPTPTPSPSPSPIALTTDWPWPSNVNAQRTLREQVRQNGWTKCFVTNSRLWCERL